jgi:hypothetical protein
MSSAHLRVRSSRASDHFDLLIIAIGYEERSRHVAQTLGDVASRKVAFCFPSSGVLSFDENLEIATEAGFSTCELTDSFADDFSTLLEDVWAAGGRTVGIDVSSFTKFHLAEMVDGMSERMVEGLEVDFFYAPASSDEWVATDSPIQVAEPIHPAFASWTDDPTLPLVAIIGLGVEENLALGVAEQLDVSGVYAFTPSGSDSGFDAMGAEANHEFFLADYVVRSSSYSLLSPFDLFSRLESLIYGLRSQSRIALVPLGPKIFALCSLLATVASGRAATVWRFSRGLSDEPKDVRAAGAIVSLRVSRVGNGLSAD